MVSWFISPWEVARVSMEAQRLMAVQLFGFVLPTAQPKEKLRQERASGEEKTSVPGQSSSITSSKDVLIPSKQIERAHKKTVAARSNTLTGELCPQLRDFHTGTGSFLSPGEGPHVRTAVSRVCKRVLALG